MEQTRFNSTWDFAETSFFKRVDGRLRVDLEQVGPIIDVHTHLALTFVGKKPTVDLLADNGPTKHYLPMERAVDLNVYGNRSMSPEDVERLRGDLTLQSLKPGGMRATHTAPNLMAEMEDLQIAYSVLLPIEFPRISANAPTYLAICRDHEPLIGFGSVHPYDRDTAGQLDRQKEMGARGIKVHPSAQMFKPDARRALSFYRLCGERQLPILTHCGPAGIEAKLGRYLTQLKFYERTLSECPETTFILGHSGCLQMEQALDLACRYPNAYLDLSCQGLPNIRRIISEGPEDRLVFGSDWPFYHQSHPLMKILLATEDRPEMRPKIFYDNAAKLLSLPTRSDWLAENKLH